MRDFAKSFYRSTNWTRARDEIFRRDSGLCVRCGSVGEIVHHKIHLTPENISDVYIAFGDDNLELLCRVCHGAEHATDAPADGALMFDAHGDLIRRVVEL